MVKKNSKAGDENWDNHGLTTHIADLLAPWAEIAPRRMFGGVGLFARGLMFAIIIDDILYLKDSVDEAGKPVTMPFKKEYFEYDRQGKTVQLGYFKAPERALEEGPYMIELAQASHQSASLVKTNRTYKRKR